MSFEKGYIAFTDFWISFKTQFKRRKARGGLIIGCNFCLQEDGPIRWGGGLKVTVYSIHKLVKLTGLEDSCLVEEVSVPLANAAPFLSCQWLDMVLLLKWQAPITLHQMTTTKKTNSCKKLSIIAWTLLKPQ